MANELTTLADAKIHLNIPVGDVSQDAILTRFIGEASLAVEAYIDRNIVTRTYTEYQDGRSSNRILLRNFPAVKPTELRIDYTSVFTDAATLVDASEYDIDTLGNEVVLIDRMFPKGTRNIKITYDAGLAADTASVPLDISGACLWLVEWYNDTRNSRRLTQKSVGKNSETTAMRDDWPVWLFRQLDRYKRGPLDFIASMPVQNR